MDLHYRYFINYINSIKHYLCYYKKLDVQYLNMFDIELVSKLVINFEDKADG